ncbi:MAG TPA: helix-turn-helix domain-containing protein [Gemmatimonadales bacterium]|nr:helix-turn-helix domain-containing protein [Gemmatimonadales bacterium]
MSPMSFREFEPPSALREHVACFWGAEIGAVERGHMHQVIPDGCVGLIASRRTDGSTQLTLQGPRLDALWIPVQAGDRFWGVRFWPDAGPLLLGRPAGELLGALEPAAARLGPSAHDLAARLAECGTAADASAAWESLLAPMVAACPPLDAVVRTAVLAIVAARGEAPLAELAEAVGLSPRQLQRRFSAAVGLSPKQFARVRRLRGALLHVVEGSSVSWAAVAADLGFADQAHLIREFGALAGLTPVAVAERVRQIGLDGVRP